MARMNRHGAVLGKLSMADLVLVFMSDGVILLRIGPGRFKVWAKVEPDDEQPAVWRYLTEHRGFKMLSGEVNG